MFYAGRIEAAHSETTQSVTSGAVSPTIKARFELGLTIGGEARRFKARSLIIATGAVERAMPFAGWTLPGVMIVGAAQTLLKGESSIPDGKVLLAGHGPLLWLVAMQLLRSGTRPVAIADLRPSGNLWKALRHWAAAIAGFGDLAKGLGWLRAIRRQGVPVFRTDAIARVEPGKTHRLAVTLTRHGRIRVLETDWLLTHRGVVPNLQITGALRCAHDWDATAHCLRPRRDATLQTTVPGVYVAGDGGGIIGGQGAAVEGAMAGAAVGVALGITAEAATKLPGLRRARAKRQWQRRFIDRLFLPSATQRAPDDDSVIICRCEEVTVGDINQAVRDGAAGVNQLKFFTRAGMGPCQGRRCGLAVLELVSRARGVLPQSLGAMHGRPPIKPVSLRQLAQLARDVDKAKGYTT